MANIPTRPRDKKKHPKPTTTLAQSWQTLVEESLQHGKALSEVDRDMGELMGGQEERFLQGEKGLEDLPALPAISSTTFEPWFRMEGEGVKPFEQFEHYLAQGMGRVKQVTADHFGLSGSYIRKLASDMDWDRRAKAFDLWRQRIWQLKVAEQVMEMAEQHGKVAARGIEALATAFEALEIRAKDEDMSLADELATLPAKQLMAVVRDAAKAIPGLMNAERLSRGMPTEISSHSIVQSHEVTVQTTDELAELLAGLNDVLHASAPASYGIPRPPVLDVRGGENADREPASPEDE